MTLVNCDFASFSDEPCHKLTFHRKAILLNFENDEEKQLYLWRAGGSDAANICFHHKFFLWNAL